MEEVWPDLGQVSLTPDLITALVDGVAEELAATEPADLVARRDYVLTALLDLKSRAELP